MKKRLLQSAFIAIATIGLTAGWSNASSFTVEGGTAGFIPSGIEINNLLGTGVGTLSGTYGAQLKLNTHSLVTFEYLGKEAGFDNWFQVDGDSNGSYETTAFTTALSTWLTSSGPYDFVSGYVPFQFVSPIGTATNGSNPDNSVDGIPNFFISVLTSDLTLGLDSYLIPKGITKLTAGTYLWFDDAGAGDDDNHDDMLIRVSANPIPEPATMLLFGTGLAGLAGVARRRKME